LAPRIRRPAVVGNAFTLTMLHVGEVQVESAVLFETPEQICGRVFRTLCPAAPPPEIRVEFRRFASANSLARLRGGCLHVRITDALEGAPAPVLEALFYMLLGKLFRRPVPDAYRRRYRLYLNRRDVRNRLHGLRRARSRKFLTAPKGSHYDLEELFEDLNARYFHGALPRPALSWSRRPSRRILGHYDPAHNAIVISRLLDSQAVPRLAVEYVLFHEMLHLHFPEELNGAQRRVHTRSFREAERMFPELRRAKQMLRSLTTPRP